ncbi:MAG: ABC transporter substrate-binding protein [Dehalococcoidia bacterium]|nr:ABC transporter substrate-binding protein [Dehalococcoidia bacterium]
MMTQKSGSKAFSRREVLKAFGAVTGAVAVGPLLQACTAASGVPPAAPIASTEVPPAAAPAVANAGTVTLNLKKLDGSPVIKSVEAPRYGGTLTIAIGNDVPAWDDYISTNGPLNLVTSELLQGDWSRGPAGTEETSWYARDFYSQFETGDLAESWEVPDPETIVLHIRRGVRWQDKAPVGGREFTAEDVVSEFNRKLLDTKSWIGKRDGIGSWFESAEAVDKYTVVVKGKEQRVGIANAFNDIVEQHYFLPPEVVKSGPLDDWKSHVGTGPFILEDYVPGSSATFKRNPNYWQHDPLFPQNQLPYLDSVKLLIIQDAATRFSALSTRQIDITDPVRGEDAEQLLLRSPELKYNRMVSETTEGTLFMRTDKPPFNDIRVRRALAMAIDRQAILKKYYNDQAELAASLPNLPDYAGMYVPMDQLPESSRELYEYHPDRAKQLLAEAGYPDGLKFTAVIHRGYADMAQLYQVDLAKIGVDMQLDVREFADWTKSVNSWPKQFEEAAFVDQPIAKRILQGSLMVQGVNGNFPVFDDPVINEAKLAITSFDLMNDVAKKTAACRDLALHLVSQCGGIQPPFPLIYNMWTPWVKNYYGPTMGAYDALNTRALQFVWIDQDMKKTMAG